VNNYPSFTDLLVSNHIIDPKSLQKLVGKYQGNHAEIRNYILGEKTVRKDILGKLWGDSIGVSYVNLDKTLFQSQVMKRLDEKFVRRNKMIPLYEIQGVITLAMAHPKDINVIDKAERLMGCPVSPVFSFPDEIVDAVDIQYQSSDGIDKILDQISNNPLFKKGGKITSQELEKFAGEQSVIAFSRSILLLGVKEGASDIHIDPQENIVHVRFRIDGMLHDRMQLEKMILAPLTSRLKIMASLDITEKRRPQDGRVNLNLNKKSIDFRMSTVPTIYGEKIVLRALGSIQKDEVLDLEDLGFSKTNLEFLKKIMTTPTGIFFVTGPTGSGKSTTLFSVLQALNKSDVNIMTIEDPVEYRLPRINQIQVNSAIGFDFASALRSFLRQDPDIILVGEIRDKETAKIASEAALTGHLVLATMHTNSALQAVIRLIEIGVEPYLISPSIIGTMAQRLIRRICKHCKESYKLSAEEIEKYFIWDKQTDVYFYRGKGCPECNNIGYSGRLAIQEISLINDEIRSLIGKRASALEIENAAKRGGLKKMHYDGMKKVLMGLTTIDEIERVTAGD